MTLSSIAAHEGKTLLDIAGNETKLRSIVDEVVDRVRKATPSVYEEAIAAAQAKGKPKPRKGDFEAFGIAVFTREGETIAAGNAGVSFPISPSPRSSPSKWPWRR